MSYILDALKKSEQARLNVDMPLQQLLLRGEDARPVPRRIWPYVVGVALLLNLAAIFAWWRTSKVDLLEQPARSVAAATPAQVASMPLPSALPIRGAPSAAMPGTPPAGAVSVQDGPVRPQPAPTVTERTAVAPAVAPGAPAMEPAPASSTAARAASAVPNVTVAPASPGVSAPAATERGKAATSEFASMDLPEAIRKELPPLVVSGVMREAGSSGLVIVNERPLREGEEVVPGLKVERILERGAQFSYKGHRFQR